MYKKTLILYINNIKSKYYEKDNNFNNWYVPVLRYY